jgi:hypothetical protein
LILSNDFGQIGSWTIFSIIVCAFILTSTATSLLKLKPIYSILIPAIFLGLFISYPSLSNKYIETPPIISGEVKKSLLWSVGSTKNFSFTPIKHKGYLEFELESSTDLDLYFESQTWGILAITTPTEGVVWTHEVPEAPNIANTTPLRLGDGTYRLQWFSDLGAPINIVVEKKITKQINDPKL